MADRYARRSGPAARRQANVEAGSAIAFLLLAVALSRIVAVADTFSAITTTRSYRRAQTPEVAIAELKRCAGTQFDPKVVEAVVAVLERPGPATTDEPLELASYGLSGGPRETNGAGTLVSEQAEQPL